MNAPKIPILTSLVTGRCLFLWFTVYSLFIFRIRSNQDCLFLSKNYRGSQNAQGDTCTAYGQAVRMLVKRWKFQCEKTKFINSSKDFNALNKN